MKRFYFIPSPFFLFILVSGLLLFTHLSPAQVASASVDTTGAVVPAETGFFAGFPLQEAVNSLVTLLTLFLSWLIVKKLLPMIPNWLIPILAGTVLPWLSNWLVGLAATPDLGMWEQSLYGLFAVVLHQVYKQISGAVKGNAN